MSTLVKMENVVKEFPGVKALDNISFDVKAGEVHVLLGENGAGKSTLMKILSGVYSPTSGNIIVGGKSYSKLTPKESKDNKISIIYQELSVVNELSIMENLFVGVLPMKKQLGFINMVDYNYMEKKAIEVMKKVGLKREPKTPVEELSISEKQLVEIGKSILAEADIVIMDEPTASLTGEEIKELFTIVRKMKEEGKGIIFISHKLEEIIEIGDRVSVLKDGTYVGTKEVKGINKDDLVRMMVGRDIKSSYQKDKEHNFEKDPVIFEVDHLSRKDGKSKDVSFKLHKGEILGFSGLVGSGRSELMNAIFGAEPKLEGKVLVNGKEVSTKSPYVSIQNGIAMVTENRRETGFFHNFDIKKNISILPFIKDSSLGGLGGILNMEDEKKWAEEQKKALLIKCSSVNQGITELSGGNQQKVILAKWMAAESEIIIFDEPTKGIDVGAKGEIYELMRQLANNGKGVLMVSSELPELLGVCDTIAVFKEGRIAKTFAIKDATEENIMLAATSDV